MQLADAHFHGRTPNVPAYPWGKDFGTQRYNMSVHLQYYTNDTIACRNGHGVSCSATMTRRRRRQLQSHRRNTRSAHCHHCFSKKATSTSMMVCTRPPPSTHAHSNRQCKTAGTCQASSLPSGRRTCKVAEGRAPGPHLTVRSWGTCKGSHAHTAPTISTKPSTMANTCLQCSKWCVLPSSVKKRMPSAEAADAV